MISDSISVMNARSSELKQQIFDSTALLIPFELLSGLVMNKQVLFFENIKPSVMKMLFFQLGLISQRAAAVAVTLVFVKSEADLAHLHLVRWKLALENCFNEFV